ncbi:MAG: alanine racemase [Ferrimicrobium sp.]|jgi:D-serine deaminase-like pyridoxal phosphate-dependent protein|nr:alanine racemase [Ferrimicrobium sp.]
MQSWSIPDDIATPSLLVNLEAVDANAKRMAQQLSSKHITLRPHTKTHKSVDLARLQYSFGANGISVATIGEAEVFAAAGFDDIFVALPVWCTAKIASKLNQLATMAKLRIGVDSIAGAQALATQIDRSDQIEVMIEVDSGQHRTGVRPNQAGQLAHGCQSRGLSVRGVFTHGGHSYQGRDAVERAAADEISALTIASESFSDQGLTPTVVSAGSSPTALHLGGVVTEARPGTYLFNDRQQVALGAALPDQVAAVVATRVISTAVPGQFVIDAGSKALVGESSTLVAGYGEIRDLEGAIVTRLSEHHGIVSFDGTPPPVGTLLQVVPNHICTVINLFDQYLTLRGSSLAEPIRIDARGHLT